MHKRLAVIKTGWCDSYDNQDAHGNFGHLIEGGDGAERFNMRPTARGFEVYALPKGEDTPPLPEPADQWTIVHVARDPAEGRMKVIGWYEDATFIGSYRKRHSADGVDRSIYCIEAPRAFEVLPIDRPAIDHDRRFGSSGIFWLRGNRLWQSKNSWEAVADRIERAVATARKVAMPGAVAAQKDGRKLLGDSRRTTASTDGIETDDGGTPYGRSPVAESPEHEALRLWACNNPFDMTGDAGVSFSRTEHPLPSGDRVDAFHRSPETHWLIEAKSRRSGEQDLERGIYQCVKYRAVTEALRKNSGEDWEVRTILLTECDLSDRLKALARRHAVIHVTRHLEDPA